MTNISTNISIIIPLEDGPKWLGGLRVERQDDEIVFVAMSSKGADKYEWRGNASELMKALSIIGIVL